MKKKTCIITLLGTLCWLMLLSIALILAPAPAQALEDPQIVAEFNDGCLRCHGAVGLKMKFQGQSVSLYVPEKGYFESQHGTNKCITCHTDIVDYPHVGASKGKELEKIVNGKCQRCHADVTKVYVNSAHAKANAVGKEVYCWSCHGTHNILKKEDQRAKDYRTNIPETCGHCHDPKILESYEESFHGKAVMSGSKKAASCVDCHGAHNIVGPKEPNSPVSEKNVPQTCAKCHYKAAANFAKGTEHWVFERGGPGEPMYWTLKFMIWLTISVITIFFIHLELDLYRRLKNQNNKNDHQ
jgi:hypothetical protein